jgi:acyl carrier protein phosphodiesterase
MNFLGHLFFSDNNLELMYANLFGDFVKGKDLSAFSPVVQSGIVLHRSIDFYIDQHPEVRKLMHILYPVLPKVTGIAIDLYFDHCLAKNWKSYHAKSYKDFLDEFYAYQPEKWQE